MLSPQGPAQPKRLSDPKLVSSYEIAPSMMLNVLRLAGGALFVVVCAWCVLTPSDQIFDKIMLGVCGVFFAYFVIVQGQQVLRHKPPAFSREGLTMDIFGARKLIPWSNIEETKLWSYRTSRTNIVTLVNPQLFAAQFTPEEMKNAIRDERFGNFFGVLLGLFTPGGASPRDEPSKFAHLLALRRERYGGEVLLAGTDRDRPPEEFNALIEEWKATYG